MDREQRFDISGVRSKPRKTPQGFIRMKANLTRTGVLTYVRQDGTIVKELRHPDEVFKADSLSTLEDAPVTDLHPSSMVDATNVRGFQRGIVRTARRDGRFIAGEVLIQDDALIQAVERGDRKELSPGYTCRIDPTPGEFEGVRYDCIQRDITYNHVAVGPGGWGRSGPEVALRSDSKDGDVESLPYAIQAREDGNLAPEGPKQEGDEMSGVVRIDGIEYKVDESAEPHINKELGALQGKIEGLSKQVEELQGKLDGVTAQRDELKEKLDAETSAEALQAKIAARVALETASRKVLGDEEKFDSLSDHELRCKVVSHGRELNLDGKSEEYVLGMFESVVEIAKSVEKKADGSISRVREASAEGSGKSTDERFDSDAARQRMLERNRNAYRQEQE